jgi:hypothetical protein
MAPWVVVVDCSNLSWLLFRVFFSYYDTHNYAKPGCL